MSRKKLAKSAKEFDRRFDEGEDIHDLIDMSEAKIIRHGKKVRITLDIAEELVRDIDRIRDSIGVDRAALIKVWLHERVKQEKATGLKR
jgi:hypothetical protein